MDNRRYFFISGFISFFFFSFFLSLFIYMAFTMSKIKQYAFEKEQQYVSISIAVPEKLEFSKKQDISSLENEIMIQEPIEEDKSFNAVEETEQKDIDIDDLFSDVWTQKIPKIKEEKKHFVEKRINHKLLNKLKEETKILKVKKSEVVKKTLNKIHAIKTFQKNNKKVEKKKSTAQEVNKYLAEINAIVYANFYPPKNSEGYSVESVIILSALGHVEDFRILRYSSNKALNKECERLSIRLKNKIFPLNPLGKKTRTKIILTSKE